MFARFAAHALLGLGALFAGAAAAADEFRLGLPVRCTPGADCFIQNYVDRDPGPGWRDYACGHLAYDGHLGTDFRVASLAQMDQGVEVLASAPGRVVAVRDGEPDVAVGERGRATVLGREAGNGVRIDHGDGWETQYSHLRRSSVRVRAGQRVNEGEVLGLIGLSGHTEFPHLDFVVRRSGRILDPFSPPSADSTLPEALALGDAQCADGPSASMLWHEELREALRYRPSAVLIAGFAPEAADRGKAQRGEYQPARIGRDARALVFWIEAAGMRRGDIEWLELRAPGGASLAQRVTTLEGNLAVRFSFVGRNRSAAAWPAGVYRARYRLMRDQLAVLEREVEIDLR
ncbi:MAG: M23 family metallopeptidase [Burkholderiaceae bacterium]|nr:M23 family metallopeptidase [Burkholderiaceae bacterium]